MSETRSTTRPEAALRDGAERWTATEKRTVRMSEWTYMLIITVGAALLTGILALPFTMPGRGFAAPYVNLLPQDDGPALVRTHRQAA